MHDIDRTQAEFESDLDAMAPHQGEFGDELEFEEEMELEAPLDEVEEMELASELLEVTEEGELDHFFGKLFKKIGRRLRRVANPLGGMLKGLARRALPMLAGSVGTSLGGPLGGMLGGQLAGGVGQAFGLELEGLSPEDQEFETARQFVRFARSAARHASNASAGSDPRAAAKGAIIAAARRYAPGLLGGKADSAAIALGGGRRSGRWLRRGNRIILFGV